MIESTLFIEGLGIVAGALGLCAWIPQTLDVWVKKKNDGVSLATLSLIITALTLWTIYGFLKGSISLILANGIALFIIAFVALGIIKLRVENGDPRLMILPNLLLAILNPPLNSKTDTVDQRLMRLHRESYNGQSDSNRLNRSHGPHHTQGFHAKTRDKS